MNDFHWRLPLTACYPPNFAVFLSVLFFPQIIGAQAALGPPAQRVEPEYTVEARAAVYTRGSSVLYVADQCPAGRAPS